MDLTVAMPGDEKLQKVLARAGYGSRREIEGWIRDGRVQVNDRPAVLGARIGPADVVAVDGKRVDLGHRDQTPCRVLIYNKPEGEVTTRHDPQGRPTVFDRLPVPRQGRWIAVGRLDVNSAGLLLLTTDGELAHRLMHPARGVDREYAVRLRGEVDGRVLERLKSGVKLEDGFAHFDDIREGGSSGTNRWYFVVSREGRKRLVRRLWESQGLQVSRLIRVRYGPVHLPQSLKRGEMRELDRAAINQLRNWVQLPALERGPRWAG